MRRPFLHAIVVHVLGGALSLALPTYVDAQNRSRQFESGKCGPVDPVYLKTASETGGHPFFLSPSEVVASGQIMRETSGADDTLILWASDSGGEREFVFPVDGTIARMTLSAMFDTTGGVMTIVTPDG